MWSSSDFLKLEEKEKGERKIKGERGIYIPKHPLLSVTGQEAKTPKLQNPHHPGHPNGMWRGWLEKTHP